MPIEPFRVEVEEIVLVDLARRLDRARLPNQVEERLEALRAEIVQA